MFLNPPPCVGERDSTLVKDIETDDRNGLSRRRYLTLATVSGTALVAGCSGSKGNGSGSGSNASGSGTTQTSVQSTNGGGSTATGTSTGTSSETQTQTETGTGSETTTGDGTETTSGGSASGYGPEEFSGSGTETAGEIGLSSGPITAEFSHDGSSNFITDLVALEGDSLNDVNLTNTIGDVEGSQVRGVAEEDTYALNVNADGEWSITLEQPANPSPESLPIDASGDSIQYVGPFEFDGAVEFQGSHDGSSNFIVEAVPLDPDTFGSIVFNEIGSFEGSTTVRIDGIAYLNVQADGDWTLQTN